MELNSISMLDIIWDLDDDDVCERTARSIVSQNDIIWDLEEAVTSSIM